MTKRQQYSSIWGHYTQTLEGNTRFATCNYCCQKFKTCGTTTTLWRHYKTKHVKADTSVDEANASIRSHRLRQESIPPLLCEDPVSNIEDEWRIDSKTIVIGIAGGSGAGKTTLSNAISQALGVNSVNYLPHDSYYKSLPTSHASLPLLYNFDDPSCFETELLISHIHQLKQGLSVHVPTYDYSTYQRIENETKLMKPKRIILVEGILVFNHIELVKELDVKVYVDTSADVRLLRRIQRDTTSRKRMLSQVLQQHTTYTEPMHLKHIEVEKNQADIIVNGNQSMIVGKDMIVSYIRDRLDQLMNEVNETKITIEKNNCDFVSEERTSLVKDECDLVSEGDTSLKNDCEVTSEVSSAHASI